jgi:D-sedoheptulose 7-phosphate isomerase
MDAGHIEAMVRESIAAKQRLLDQLESTWMPFLAAARDVVQAGGTLYFCGNGGSSCDAAHAAGELIGWFLEKDRGPIAAVALGHEIPALTAIANDSGYTEVFARQIEALGRPGDMLIGISTSGGSKNVVRALETARGKGLRTAAWTGRARKACAELAEFWVPMPSEETPRVQECHLLLVHALCAYLEAGPDAGASS